MNKILMLTTVALLGSTSLVAAQETTAVNAFSIDAGVAQDSDGLINLGLVTAEADGVIEIYDIDDVNMEDILGSQAIVAGANTDVKVTLQRPADSDVMAVLRVNGAVVATAEVDLDRDFGDNSTGDGDLAEGDDSMSNGDDDSGNDDSGSDDAAGDDSGSDDSSDDSSGG